MKIFKLAAHQLYNSSLKTKLKRDLGDKRYYAEIKWIRSVVYHHELVLQSEYFSRCAVSTCRYQSFVLTGTGAYQRVRDSIARAFILYPLISDLSPPNRLSLSLFLSPSLALLSPSDTNRAPTIKIPAEVSCNVGYKLAGLTAISISLTQRHISCCLQTDHSDLRIIVLYRCRWSHHLLSRLAAVHS
ncbi:hypothetical protein PoB_000314800 [Plakobranchus ocellatus]|uniref:Uncharacterized protein n=1 Tax=Plakobranchus ocellatus TaxID=259542 RepID=A0AAV3Y316_9GAST|nr:hypothetical protein PoB_000314800 [Plakobranchus ocellatus]